VILDPCPEAYSQFMTVPTAGVVGAMCLIVSVPRVGEISLERAGEEAYTLSRHRTFAPPPEKKTTRRTRPIMCRVLGFRVAI